MQRSWIFVDSIQTALQSKGDQVLKRPRLPIHLFGFSKLEGVKNCTALHFRSDTSLIRLHASALFGPGNGARTIDSGIHMVPLT
jgi:hypothetical protein